MLIGKVLDATTGLPLNSVSVYINNSSKGTSTNANGEFILENIAITDFDIVATCVGYQTFSKTINATIILNTLEIKLFLKPVMLEAVVLQSYEKDGWKKWGKVFLESIVGNIEASKYCEIKNKETIKFIFNKKLNELTAITDEPLIIENKYLGYQLRYDLINFTTNFHTRIIAYEGYPFFTPLNASAKKMKKWKKNREYVYEGSIMHFMRSLYRNKLDENGFEIRVLYRFLNLEKQRVKNLYKNNMDKYKTTFSVGFENDSSTYYQKVLKQSDSSDYVYPNKIKADSIAYIVDSTTAGIFFNNHLQVKHTTLKSVEYFEGFQSGTKNIYPTSIISLVRKNDLVVFSNGSYYDPSGLMTEGYWGMYEKLSTLLPSDYTVGD